MPARHESFASILTEAVADLATHGFDTDARVAGWMERLRRAAEAEMLPPARMAELLRRELGTIYQRLVERGTAIERHPGVGRFTLEKVKPQLRADLDRRLMASMSLIKLNRDESMARTLKRFQGWATSIPVGGSDVLARQKSKIEMKRALASLPFEERRVVIDQGHKLIAAIHETIAQGGGAIAAKWRHVHQAGYNGRPDHEARDQKVFLLRGSWAHRDGLVKPDRSAGYTDDIERVGQLPFCRCWYVYFYNLRDLPAEMLTAKGRAAMANIRVVA